jgi:D-inositol-3-phosphate glycosyltransferase
MRVALVSAQPAPETDRHGVAQMAVELGRLGHDVRVFERRDSTDDPPPQRDGYRVERVPAGPPRTMPVGELLRVVPDLSRALAERWTGDWTPDVVHGHYWIGGLAAASAVRGTGIPIVQTFHSLGVEQRRRLGPAYAEPGERIPLERALTRAVDLAVVQSTDEVEELARMGIKRTAVAVVPTGVDPAAFTPEGDAEPRSGRRILSVGGFGPADRHDDLIRAMRLVGDAELVITGEPAAETETERLRELARRMGVDGQVTLIGRVPHEQMPRWYRSADLVACAPRTAAVGSAPVEAMACGVPVVGYALGAVADTVVDEVTGRLVAPGDVRALGMGLRRLLADDARRFAFRHAAVDRVRCRYTWERTAGALERIYQGLLGRRGASGGTLSAAAA